MPLRVHAALEHWREAERVLAATPPEAPERADAEKRLVAARDAYLALVMAVAEELGTEAMADLTQTQVRRLMQQDPTSGGAPGQ
jgi:hypothetical protein